MSTEVLEPIDTKNDAIKLPLTFNVEKIKAEVDKIGLNSFIYYDVLPLRSPAHLVDPSIPFPPPAQDYADGSWCDWLNTKELENSPCLKSIVETFQEKTKVTLVRALRLENGNIVKEHTDPTLGLQIEKSVIRLTIPVIKDSGADFYLNDKIVPMKPGECWYLRLTDPHKVLNNSGQDRVNITIDMIPNTWIRNLILENDV
ncbi:aspartyl/asparaginyl beta-hydroxylase domain-containing protein [Hyunsoonleella sp. SJ7]|uniref:Aspartyl/asparaginyl beta-hydroxylase domain-containing protein n=1 Tax=Hyunsoonleella aquatilis TaxID=2762758 RepID=A0A923H831_9FLAO|nr:aspartyl/asparaginyl beta-hydroxylase domain-containing protein [Hyunsoonleella aquatilis]MBC3757713.1 aspartyl/asparaginyl beta-hydroxylase domain-containing protein [Hyunsoonleella aquatilis]